MASETEGIALLSMYIDEEEEEELHHQQQHEDVDCCRTRIDQETEEVLAHNSIVEPLPHPVPSKSPQNLSSPSPEVKALRSPTPPPWPRYQHSSPPNLASPSSPPPIPCPLPLPPRPQPAKINGQNERRGALAILDYGHDEADMSPEAEEGEIMSSGCIVVGMEIHTSEGNFEERMPLGAVQLLAPSTQPEPLQPSNLPEQSRSETSMAIHSTGTEPEMAQAEIAVVFSEEVQQDDTLKSFLPPPVMTRCPEELQEKVNKLLAYKKAGKSLNTALRNKKDYRNPDFLQHAVSYQEIDHVGTCFSKDVFDPHGYDDRDYFDNIEADMKREMERIAHERKKSQKIDFVLGGTQPSTVTAALKTSTQIPGISAAATSVSVSKGPQDAREIRLNKKSKWDKDFICWT